MSAPVLTVRQRQHLFSEAAAILESAHPQEPLFRQAVSMLDLLGWQPEGQETPLASLDGSEEDLRRARAFAAAKLDEWAALLKEDEAKAQDAEEQAQHSRESLEMMRAAVRSIGQGGRS